MKELGVKVLNKIQNLISMIDQNPNASKKKAKNSIHQISFGQQQRKLQTQAYVKKLSYSYLNRQQKTQQKLKHQVYRQEAQCVPFKITNKKTIDILNRKQLKPLYERFDQIMVKRQNNIEQLHRQNFVKEIQSMRPANSSFDYGGNSNKKMNVEELQQFRNDVDEKNHLRIQKKHFKQLGNVKRQIYTGIPSIARSSRSLSKIHNSKNNFSQDVFERLNQDSIDRSSRHKQLKSKRLCQEGGFKPVLCVKSRVLAQNSKSRRSIFEHSVDSQSHSKCKKVNIPKPIYQTTNNSLIIKEKVLAQKQNIILKSPQSKYVALLQSQNKKNYSIQNQSRTVKKGQQYQKSKILIQTDKVNQLNVQNNHKIFSNSKSNSKPLQKYNQILIKTPSKNISSENKANFNKITNKISPAKTFTK